MKNVQSIFTTLYNHFNDRKIDLVITNMTTDVQWANGMEGGFVYGHEGVKEYWTRQFGLVSSKVTPLEIKEVDGKVKIRVHQVVYDLNGNLVADEIVFHKFTMSENKISRFEIDKQDLD